MVEDEQEEEDQESSSRRVRDAGVLEAHGMKSELQQDWKNGLKTSRMELQQ